LASRRAIIANVSLTIRRTPDDVINGARAVAQRVVIRPPPPAACYDATSLLSWAGQIGDEEDGGGGGRRSGDNDGEGKGDELLQRVRLIKG